MRIRRLLRFTLALTVLAVGSLLFYLWSGIPARAAVRALLRTNPSETSLMRQRAREATRRGRRSPRRVQSWVPLSRISQNLVHAVVVAEDAKFYAHAGVDWDAIRESAERNWQQRRFVRGGSTITQQLAKNLFFSTQRSLLRKLRELVVTRWLEHDLGKARILELYLNVIEWGDSIYGCEAAAHRYYGKAAAELSLAEAAGLAAMIPAPRRLNPEVDPRRHAQAQKRVLWLLALAGYGERPAADQEPAEVAPVEDDEPAEQPAPATTLPAPDRGIQ